ncbi:hypothetical protein Fuma_00716 [Fuerstiella marisgermanici]|uniref:Uncharacterized protein n=1 Tax=Fuerstiella marisgermanici TaxID=1891926 RepID=A0A1P8WAP9_9PLAN|nr:hypothetical protein Fuma_00716 [Fuerstiella marisgermanici]
MTPDVAQVAGARQEIVLALFCVRKRVRPNWRHDGLKNLEPTRWLFARRALLAKQFRGPGLIFTGLEMNGCLLSNSVLMKIARTVFRTGDSGGPILQVIDDDVNHARFFLQHSSSNQS